MLDRQNQVLFVHVPKTGGQSVESVFLDLHGLRWDKRAPLLLRPNADRALGPARLAHLTAREYVSLDYMTTAEFGQFYKFAFVRNPWSRLVSEFHYRELEPATSFADFVRQSLAYTDDFLDLARHVMPQSNYVCDRDGQIIVDFVGRFETLADDFATAAAAIGLVERKLPHRNKSDNVSLLRKNPRKFLKHSAKRLLSGSGTTTRKTVRKPHYSAYFTPDLADQVGEFYRRDIELFNYQFERATAP